MGDTDQLREWLDARSLAEWIEAERPDYRSYGNTVERAMWRWKNNTENVNIFQVDRHLVNLELHEWEIPEHVWVEDADATIKGPQRSRKRREAEVMIGEGYTNLEIRKHFEDRGEWIDKSQLSTWRSKLDKGDRV